MREESFSVIFLVLLLGIVSFVRAEDSTSTNFISRDPVMSDFGGDATSANFEAINSGGQTITGESVSASFLLRSGFLYFDTFTPKSQNWRWYDDETNETPTTALATENVAPSNVAEGNLIKLRMTLKETASLGGKDIKYKLQFSTFSDFSQSVNTVVSIASCAGNSLWCYADGGGADNGIITTKVLSDVDACASGVGDGCGTHNESATLASTFTHKKDAATEFEFTIKSSGAAANTTYFFRAFNVTASTSVSLNTGETYPSLSTEGAQLTVSVGGLSSGTATEGITTDVTTSPTTIPFGTLSFGAEVEAAQRFTVSTNAAAGYQIFAFQTQGLIRSGPAEILPVTGTNETPTAWATGCLSSASGCYGYHAGDDSLAAGSTRFVTNNTYAKLETTAKEVAFSSVPVTNEATDIIYKLQITNQQEAGSYDSSLVYIVVPTF